MLPPTDADSYALYIAARRARAQAIHGMFRGLAGLFRRRAKERCDNSWSLAEAPHAR
jgi:hypothetical protein